MTIIIIVIICVLVWDIWTSAWNSTYSHILSVKCSASAFTLQMPSYLTEKSFFYVLLFFSRCSYCGDGCCCCCCWVSCDCVTPLTTNVHNMMLQANASRIYDSTFEFNRIYLKQWDVAAAAVTVFLHKLTLLFSLHPPQLCLKRIEAFCACVT